MSAWPTLTPAKADALMADLPRAEDLAALADKVTLYPGGGAQAHRLRTAARLVDEVSDYLAEHQRSRA